MMQLPRALERERERERGGGGGGGWGGQRSWRKERGKGFSRSCMILVVASSTASISFTRSY